MGAAEDLQRLGLTVGTIVAVDDHPGARAPSYLLTIDLGGGEQAQSSLPTPHYLKEELIGRQVVCVPADDQVVVVGAHSHGRGLVLVRPDDEVENGSLVA